MTSLCICVTQPERASLSAHVAYLISLPDKTHTWLTMFVICGESQQLQLCPQGHKIKNPKMQLVQRLWEIPVAVRIIISGTPIQNNLMEMHSLFDFACEVCLCSVPMLQDTINHPTSGYLMMRMLAAKYAALY